MFQLWRSNRIIKSAMISFEYPSTVDGPWNVSHVAPHVYCCPVIQCTVMTKSPRLAASSINPMFVCALWGHIADAPIWLGNRSMLLWLFLQYLVLVTRIEGQTALNGDDCSQIAAAASTKCPVRHRLRAYLGML
jgi:hypothetical protein